MEKPNCNCGITCGCEKCNSELFTNKSEISFYERKSCFDPIIQWDSHKIVFYYPNGERLEIPFNN